MFLVGGPAFSGTTLLAHLLNQGKVVCLDEPDFHNPEQAHRGIPFLEKLFPDRYFPKQPEKALTYKEAFELIQKCEKAIEPYNLGIKACNWTFIEYAKIYKRSGYPVIAIIRDIRDALMRPLPIWVNGEKGLNNRYRLIWKNLKMFDLWLRYEDLVLNPHEVIAKISKVLSYNFKVLYAWDANNIHPMMFKSDRHELLKIGAISKTRVGFWKNSGKIFSRETRKTAKMMGY